MNQRGFGLMEVVIATGIGAVLGGIIVATQVSAIKVKQKTELMDWMHELRVQSMRAIQNPVAWTHTVNNNPTLNCVRNKTSCTGAGGSVVLYEADGRPLKLIHNGTASHGITPGGNECNSFSAAGNEACPYRFSVRWTPRCHSTDSNCSYPQIELAGALEQGVPVSGSDAVRVNSARYGFRVTKAEEGHPLRNSCLSIGGSWNAGTRKCELIDRDVECAPNEVVKGFTRDGQLICQTLPFVTCPAGQVLAGFDSNGNKVCNTGCAARLGEPIRSDPVPITFPFGGP
jgi:hypothetical protein